MPPRRSRAVLPHQPLNPRLALELLAVAQLVQQWKEVCLAGRGLSASYRKREAVILGLFARLWGTAGIERLTRADLYRFAGMLRKRTTHQGKKLGDTTVRGYSRSAAYFADWLYRREYCPVNASDGFERAGKKDPGVPFSHTAQT